MLTFGYRKLQLMPSESASGATLHIIIAVMNFLACLTLGAVLTLSDIASGWSRGLSASMTVQLAVTDQISAEDQTDAAMRVLQSWPGILRARALSREEAASLLEPWLGQGNVLQDLPVPQLIEVQIKSGEKVDTQALRAALGAVPGATLDDHKHWNEELSGFARSALGVGWAVLGLITLATLAVIVFATQAGLNVHRDIVEVVHMIGAKDVFIAREYERHFLWLGLRGGLIGLMLSLVTLMGAAWIWDRAAGPGSSAFTPHIMASPWHLLWLILVPLASAAIATLTARMTVLRVIGRMP
ncbi:MAG TPA: hypothetical protein DCL54_18055 [Alphaproteobacteria bacterium]|nr:hypothetical protein [Alphaproteobacteria bacterium]HAJ48484.1 hypothetical protein [Alphaproteobacteria bacterium]